MTASISLSNTAKKRVSYFYDNDVGSYTYGPTHPMKPHRMRMTHNLIVNYDLYNKMDVIKPDRATQFDMTRFHTDEYIQFLHRVTPENASELASQYVGSDEGISRFNVNVGEDCPAFDGLFEFCSISAGGSIGAAQKLNDGSSDICINWSGGLHHAKKTEASGFCYVNDIVLAILELLRFHQRVVYIDIDVHHGDGVEEAFYTTDRVLTCSFHKFGEYFPGTGDIEDIGLKKGKYYAVNFPLRDGIDDESYHSVFRPIVAHIMQWYRPGAVVLQCGGDSLAGDKLGCFNLSMHGHAECVEFVKSFNLPLIVLGGGGYTVRNVSRAWTYETAVLLGEKLSEELPYNDYWEYYGPEYKLEIPANNMDNLNTRQYLEGFKSRIIDNLRHLPFAPSVQVQEVPRDWYYSEDEEEEEDPEVRISQRARDARIVPTNELSDSDDEIGDNRRNNHSYRRPRRRKEKESPQKETQKREFSEQPRRAAKSRAAAMKREGSSLGVGSSIGTRARSPKMSLLTPTITPSSPEKPVSVTEKPMSAFTVVNKGAMSSSPLLSNPISGSQNPQPTQSASASMPSQASSSLPAASTGNEAPVTPELGTLNEDTDMKIETGPPEREEGMVTMLAAVEAASREVEMKNAEEVVGKGARDEQDAATKDVQVETRNEKADKKEKSEEEERGSVELEEEDVVAAGSVSVTKEGNEGTEEKEEDGDLVMDEV